MDIKRVKLVVLAVLCAFTFAGCKKNVGAEEDNPVNTEQESDELPTNLDFRVLPKKTHTMLRWQILFGTV